MLRNSKTRSRLTLTGLVLFLSIALLLAGCGNDAMTASEVYTKAMKASEDMKSFAVDMKLKQQVVAEGEDMTVEMDMNMEAVLKPELQMYLNMNMEEFGEPMNIEMYMVPDGLYMSDPMSGEWFALPAEMMDQITGSLSADDMDPSVRLEQLEQLIDELSVEEKGDNYIIKLSGSSQKLKDFILEEYQEELLGPISEESAEMTEVMESLKINKAEFTFEISKKTYYLGKMDIVLDIELEAEGEKGQIIMDMSGEYSKINDIKEIKVPEEALQAQSMF